MKHKCLQWQQDEGLNKMLLIYKAYGIHISSVRSVSSSGAWNIEQEINST